MVIKIKYADGSESSTTKAKESNPNMGFVLEEVLRAYFLRAGFFVVRGVPVRIAGEDLTDIDLWLYDRPTGTSRRVQICDIKYKQKPKAVERLFWTAGLVTALDVDGAYVATTDKRTTLHSVSKKLGLQLIDGADIQRISAQNLLFPERLNDEEFVALLSAVDVGNRDKALTSARFEMLESLSEGFGAASLIRAITIFGRLAIKTVEHHPGSVAARACGRLAYLAASLICVSLDFLSVEAAFRSIEERKEILLRAVRFGVLGSSEGQQSLKLAIALVEKYGAGGRSFANQIDMAFKKDLESIPAEIIADQAATLLKGNRLHVAALQLEAASYARTLLNFDELDIFAKSMLGALLDFSRVNRKSFAEAWVSLSPPRQSDDVETESGIGSERNPPTELQAGLPFPKN